MATIIEELYTIITTRFEGNKEIQAAVNGYKQLDRQFQDTVKNMTRGAAVLGAAMTGVGTTVVRAIVPYEHALNDLRAFADLTGKELTALDRQAREIGSSGRFGATDVLEGQREFLRNQFSVNETLAATNDIERLATAGLMDMDQAANLVAHTLRRFDLGAEQTGHVTDVLASMTQKAGLNLADLEATFRRAALVADRLGVSFEDTAASVSILAREGLRPREAGSLLQAMLDDLTELSDAANEELGRVGLDAEFFRRLASEGQITRLFDELRASGADIAKVFSTEGIDAAQILFDAGDEYAQLADQFVTSVHGTSAAMAETRNLGLPGAIEDFKSAIDALQLSVGSSGLTGVVETVLDRLSAFIRWLSEVSGWVHAVAAAVLASGAALLVLAAATRVVTFAKSGFVTALRIAIGVLWLWRNAIMATRIQKALLNLQTWWADSALRRFVARLSLARIAQLAGAAATGVATGAMWAFNAALLANPIALIIAAIVALVAGLGVLIWKVDAVREAFRAAWNAILGVVQDHWDKILAIIFPPVGLPLLVARNWGQIVEIVGDIWKRINDTVRGWIDAIIDFISELPRRVLGVVTDIPRPVAEAIRDIPGVGAALDAIGGIAGAIPGFAEGGGRGGSVVNGIGRNGFNGGVPSGGGGRGAVVDGSGGNDGRGRDPHLGLVILPTFCPEVTLM